MATTQLESVLVKMLNVLRCMIVCAVLVTALSLPVIFAYRGIKWPKGHYELTGRTIPGHTQVMPVYIGKFLIMVPRYVPSRPERVWVPEKE